MNECIEYPGNDQLSIRILEYSSYVPAHVGPSVDESYCEDGGVIDYEIIDNDSNVMDFNVSYNEEYNIIKAINDYMTS